LNELLMLSPVLILFRQTVEVGEDSEPITVSANGFHADALYLCYYAEERM
jgi:hypothetical protein